MKTDLTRNPCNILSPDLYGVSFSGTKACIEEYHCEVIEAIQTVYYSKDTSKKSDFFRQVKQSYGSTAIFFSGGAGFGKFHMGVIKALVETDLMPKIIVGSSAGSMVAATICILKQHELEMLNHHQIIFGKDTLGWKADNFWDGLQHIISDKPIGCDDVLKNFIRDHV